jgi:hypothetical protein
MNTALLFPDCTTIPALLKREIRSAFVNRYLQVFSLIALGGGIAATLFGETGEAAAFFILQVTMYFVSLLALLAGVSSARTESEEWPILFSQPTPRAAFLFGKFAALWAMFAGLAAALFLPALIDGAPPAILLRLYGKSVLLAALFTSLGLWSGFRGHDRVQGLVTALGLWLVLLFGTDLLALLAARWPLIHQFPDFWVAALMLNPLDAFRIEALFAAEQIPVEAAGKTSLTQWWIGHAGLWFLLLAICWTSGLIALAMRRVKNIEL